MKEWIINIFKSKPKHQYTNWCVTSRKFNDAGGTKTQQERYCKVCGYTDIEIITRC